MAQKERFITNEQIERWLIRQQLANETTRVVTAVWWGVYTIEEAAQELRGIAYMMAGKCKVTPAVADAVAISAIDEEMQRQEAEHQESVEAMAQAGFLALQQGADRADCRAAIVAAAKERPLPPMPHLLTQAMDMAAARQRKAEFWWKRRETAE
jgi:hypothetical protein